jgi:hypothetical protein
LIEEVLIKVFSFCSSFCIVTNVLKKKNTVERFQKIYEYEILNENKGLIYVKFNICGLVVFK